MYVPFNSVIKRPLFKKYQRKSRSLHRYWVGVFLSFIRKANLQILKSARICCAFLVDALSLKVEKEDQDGNPIQLVEPKSQDRILFEVSYTTLEFAFGRAQNIQEVQERFDAYMKVIQKKAGRKGTCYPGLGDSSKLGSEWQSTGGLSTLPDADGLPTYGKSPRES